VAGAIRQHGHVRAAVVSAVGLSIPFEVRVANAHASGHRRFPEARAHAGRLRRTAYLDTRDPH